MCINMCISNLPLGALQCTIQLSIMPPPPTPRKRTTTKKTLITWFRKSKKLCVSNRNIGHKIYYL